VFGTRTPPPVSVPKAAVGHTLGAAGALDVAWTALMIRHGVVLPTPGLAQPDPELGLDLVTAPRHGALAAALCSARGYGGIHAGLVLRAPDGAR
jgi:3-oxoacyl-(acyl-carrier-protein) synthase